MEGRRDGALGGFVKLVEWGLLVHAGVYGLDSRVYCFGDESGLAICGVAGVEVEALVESGGG